ncbi:hypothetical protein JRO89_XS09G0233600 [Xanthoceras sorbifolium]|uniref:Myb-like domain-containing protein n=1 Tax=Xanthoceras sorbifolium TaxID=99658 RepID=A0ABQ8HMM9_9ROSI|nr:hypothetical protein JRO89_XS09G0233600 [Xanthoceras sorbifolium]
MVKSTSCGTTKKTCLIKGSWSRQEDQKLIAYISRYGIWNWAEMPKAAGGAEIYNNQTIEEISNGSSGCTYEELQNLWDPLPFPMEDLYYNNEFLVSTPQIWGFKENTYTSASYDDDGGNDLLAYLLMEANGETV